MQVFHPRPTAKKIDSTPSQPAGTGTGKQEMNVPLFDEAMHFMQKDGQSLDFVDDDEAVFGAKFLT